LNLDSLRGGPVFVTGHTGFKGTWLVLLLESLGVKVVGYSLEPEKDSLFNRVERRGKISETFGDIRDFNLLRAAVVSAAPKYVLHLAAQALVTDSYKDPLSTFDTNVMGTANLLEACRGVSTIEKIGVITTDKVYENNGVGQAFKESDPLGADDPYSASKVASEAVVRAWRTLYSVESNTKIISLRAGNVIGGGDFALNRLLPDIVKSRYESKKIMIRYPESTRPWQHALDPLAGYLIALTAANDDVLTDATAFNFGPESESLSVREVLEISQEHWNGALEINYGSVKPIRYEASRLDLDSKLSRESLGWNAIWTQKESVLRTLSWWDSVISSENTAEEACQVDIDFALSSLGISKF
jgi:CDP-glucose 4,6-dehydratase